MMQSLLLMSAFLGGALGQQFFLPVSLTAPPLGQPLVYGRPDDDLLGGLHQQQQQQAPLAHRDVILASEAESQLPPHLTNPFYRNPRIAQALAKESWFGPGEMHVSGIRETEKIPRGKIISVLKNAGLARRRRASHESS